MREEGINGGPEHVEMSTLRDKARLALVEWKTEKGEQHFSDGAPRTPRWRSGDGGRRKERTNDSKGTRSETKVVATTRCEI